MKKRKHDDEALLLEIERLNNEKEKLEIELDRWKGLRGREMVLSKDLFSFSKNIYSGEIARLGPISRSSSISTAVILESLPSGPERDPLIHRINNLFINEPPYMNFKPQIFIKDLHELCTRATAIMMGEQRLLRLTSPIYIFGDIHGNILDLNFFRDHCWSLGMGLTAGNFLFLGDYVDRGAYGLEVVTYLLSQKVAYPDKVFLIRGNHECRSVNGWEDYYGKGSFIAQCKLRFGDTLGVKIWEMINRVFDVMPLAAIIDNKVFAVHGGIPRQSSEANILEEIANLPKPIGIRPPSSNENLETNNLAVDLLWADPADAEQETHLGASGFGQGSRGAGAICFGNKAIEDFLASQSLNFIIRAHEANFKGISISKSARVVTIFSTSKDHGCGEGASCGCVLIENGHIFPINRINPGTVMTPRSFDFAPPLSLKSPNNNNNNNKAVKTGDIIKEDTEDEMKGGESPTAPEIDVAVFSKPKLNELNKDGAFSDENALEEKDDEEEEEDDGEDEKRKSK